MRDLDTAIDQNVGSAHEIFNTGAIEPDTDPDSCTWSQADLDALRARFPTDYRPLLYRGLYFHNFAKFDDTYARQAIEDFRRAGALNPQAALPHYFIGDLEIRGAVFLADRDAARRRAVQSLTRAIALDPTLVPALAIRANEYYRLKQYLDTITDYDAVLALDPDNASAYNDRGLAKLELGQDSAAVWDFSQSIRLKAPEQSSRGRSYQYRAEAYANVGDFRHAITDVTKAIESQLANNAILINIHTFRELYPEYDGVSDEVVARKLWTTFLPAMAYEDFADRFLNGDRDLPLPPGLSDLYISRGDAYLRLGAFQSAVADYTRVFRTFPDYTTGIDRWRRVGASAGANLHFIDVRSVAFPTNGVGRLWVKTTSSAPTYTVQAYDLNCRTKRLNTTSVVEYDAEGRVIHSMDTVGVWQQVVPGTIGEQLYDGLCATSERR